MRDLFATTQHCPFRLLADRVVRWKQGHRDVLIVLDLDHTLIHAVPAAAHRPAPHRVNVDTKEGGRVAYAMHIRPHALSFCRGLRTQRLPYAVWTAGTADYAQAVVAALQEADALFAPVFVWSRAECASNVKEMIRVQQRTRYRAPLLLDDSRVHTVATNNGLVAIVPRFSHGGSKDLFFKLLAEWLELCSCV